MRTEEINDTLYQILKAGAGNKYKPFPLNIPQTGNITQTSMQVPRRLTRSEGKASALSSYEVPDITLGSSHVLSVASFQSPAALPRLVPTGALVAVTSVEESFFGREMPGDSSSALNAIAPFKSASVDPPQNTIASRKLDAHVPFSSTHRVLDVANRQMCTEASGAFVGPMDPMQFLHQFVPPPPLKHRNEKEEKVEALLKSMADTNDEESMYPIYIAVCKQLDHSNIMVCKDSHANPDPYANPPGASSRKGLRPDVMVYRSMRDTRGQIIAYASANLELQFRTFVFSVLILGRFARLIRWDRSGAIVTRRIDYVEDPKPLVEFLWRYNFLSDAQRGYDGSVKPADVEQPDYGSALSCLRQAIGDPDTAKPFKLFLLRMIPIYEDDYSLVASEGPSSSLSARQYPETLPSRLADKSYYATNLEPDEHTHGWDYYVTAPRTSDHGPFGRATRSLYVYDRHQHRVLHLKDTNRILSPRHVVEHEVINELGDKGIQHISTVHAAWDVAPNGSCYDTLTPAFYDSEYFDPRFAPRNPMAQRGRRHYRAYRLITNELGTPLWKFRGWSGVVQAIIDILEGKRSLDGAEEAGWRHRDLSVGNILIHNGRGLLIDWDASQKSAEMNCGDDSKPPDQTGTWQFMSANRLLDPNNARHDARDDIESVFWVLLWMALKYGRHSIHADDLQEYLQDIFDQASYRREGYYKGGRAKKALLREAFDEYFSVNFTPPSLHHVLMLMHHGVGIRYNSPERPFCAVLSSGAAERKMKRYQEDLEAWELEAAVFKNGKLIRQYLMEALEDKEWPMWGPVACIISTLHDEAEPPKKRPNNRTSHILAQEIARYPPRCHP
ncbi:hypothetical protein DENSPDRAFT_854072 [Dentipellis sp. KUC8613]|nr:hypothetical protein DENSPDRAFT_854072 [Dentipellis sp. KUC8613]